MKALLLTNEYPPNVYGGAGIHVDYLSRELAKLCSVDVRCFGDQKTSSQRLSVTGFPLTIEPSSSLKALHPVFGALQRCIDFNAAGIDADVVHCHTWYTHFGGILAKQNYSTPLIVTTHSLEPLRPWKREQLAGGYDFSVWVEKTAIEMADAIIAVSKDTKQDVLRFFNVNPEKIHIIHNGIDPEEYHRVSAPDKLRGLGIDPSKPYVFFLGRITRQKGIIHLVDAIAHMDPDFQVVLCASSPDTPQIDQEMQEHVARIQQQRPGVVWIRDMVGTETKIALYSHAAVFCCPSVYEPFGIINLEAMACETPVVASAVGGIKEVVVDNETGFLVPVTMKGPDSFEPVNAEQFARDLAARINLMMKNPDLRQKMGRAGRQRVLDHFSWRSIARETHALYQSLI